MLTGQFLKKLCGNDVSLQLRVDGILAGSCAHPVSLAAFENLPLRRGAEELFDLFFAHVADRLIKSNCEPGEVGFFFFRTAERVKSIGSQLEEMLGHVRDEMVRDAFGVRPAES